MDKQVVLTRVTALLACHNRRPMTLKAVESALRTAVVAGVELDFIVYDDGSTDGTADALANAHPLSLEILPGDGTAFWAKSMAAAEARALARTMPVDYLLWLNDDVDLREDALKTLLEVATARPGAIVVGAMLEPDGSSTSYSGYVRAGHNPLRLDMVEPDGSPQPIHALHGNCVLVPVALATALGGIDGGFSHGWADVDYGLRATAQKVPILLAPRPVGWCSANRWQFSGRTILEEWRSYRSRKGAGNLESLRRILQRHSRHCWVIYVGQSYTLWWLRAFPRSARRMLRSGRSGAL